MSFSCPNLDMEECHCTRLKDDCVPGRPGCVLPRGIVFAVPVGERLRRKQIEKRAAPKSRAAGGTAQEEQGA